MVDRVDIDAITESNFTKRLAWIDFDGRRYLQYGEVDEAVNIPDDNLIEIDITKLPKEVKTIRISLR